MLGGITASSGPPLVYKYIGAFCLAGLERMKKIFVCYWGFGGVLGGLVGWVLRVCFGLGFF